MKRKSIITSVLVIVLCLGLISGSTYALFTSESKVNIAVTSGKVKMTATLADPTLYSADATLKDGTLVDKMDSSDTTGTILPTDPQGAFAGTYYYRDQTSAEEFLNGGKAILNGGTLTIDRMTPGDKVVTKLSVKNESNVAIKYRLKIAATAEDENNAKILEVLKVRFEGKLYTGLKNYASSWTTKDAVTNNTSETYESTIEIIFPLDANNDYQNKEINLAFTVEAVQSNANTVDAGTVEYVSPTAPVTQIATVSSVVTTVPNTTNTTATLVAPTAPLVEDGAKTEVVLTNVATANSTVKLTVETTEYDRTDTPTSYTVLEPTQAAVASVDLTLTVDDKIVTAFEQNASAKITTYVVKGLNDISVVYNGDADKAFGTSSTTTRVTIEDDVDQVGVYYYDAATGKLVFMTDHFSEYVPATKDEIKAINVTQNIVYSDLESAFENAKNGSTILLLKDTSVDSIVTIQEETNLILNLNGHIIKNNVTGDQYITYHTYSMWPESYGTANAAGRPFVLLDGSSLTIDANGGGMEIPDSNTNSYGFFRVYDATLVINGGTYTGSTDNGTFVHMKAYSCGEVTLNNVTASTNYRFLASDNQVYGIVNVIGGTYNQSNDGLSTPQGTIPAFWISMSRATFEDTSITSYWGECVCVNSSYYVGPDSDNNIESFFKGNNTFTVLTNNTIQSWNCCAIGIESGAVVNIEDGTYNGYKYGVYIFTSNGRLNVSGGAFTGSTAALRVDHNDNNYHPSTNPTMVPGIVVTGGTFNGALIQGNETEFIITGGTFTADPSNYVDVENYEINGEGPYIVSTK